MIVAMIVLARSHGFAHVVLWEDGVPHHEEIDVHPAYARLGFAVVDRDDWLPAMAAIVAGEAARGLDPSTRVVMAYRPRGPS